MNTSLKTTNYHFFRCGGKREKRNQKKSRKTRKLFFLPDGIVAFV